MSMLTTVQTFGVGKIFFNKSLIMRDSQKKADCQIMLLIYMCFVA